MSLALRPPPNPHPRPEAARARSSPTRASASTSPTTWPSPPGRRRTAGRTRRSSRTARSPSTRRRRSCTTRRRSSRGSRPTGTPTAASGSSGPTRTRPGWRRSARRMALPALSEEDFLASIEALVSADEAWVPGGPSGAGGDAERRAEPLPAPVHVRLRGVPRRAGRPPGHLLLHRQPGRPVLRLAACTRCGSGSPRPTTAPAPAAPARPSPAATTRPAWSRRRRRREGLRPGDVHRRGRAALGRGAGRDERLPGHHRQRAGHPGAQRHDPRGRHPGLDPDPGRASSGSPRSSGRSARGAARGHRLRSGRRGLRLRHRRGHHPDRTARRRQRRPQGVGGRDRRGHRRAAQEPARRPVRPRRGHPRLDAPGP